VAGTEEAEAEAEAAPPRLELEGSDSPPPPPLPAPRSFKEAAAELADVCPGEVDADPDPTDDPDGPDSGGDDELPVAAAAADRDTAERP
jgi:hypothetical protein